MIKYLVIIMGCSCLAFMLWQCSSPQEHLKAISVSEFSEFVEETGYVTDAERYGWSIVQLNVYEFKTVENATWRKPDSEHEAMAENPVTQVSYNDARAYCAWSGERLPSYEEYWQLAKQDKRTMVYNNILPISAVGTVNVVGNVWDITEPLDGAAVRLAGGSLFCSARTCNGTQKERELFVDKETGNVNVGFSVVRK